jgi:hypothetical protein
LGLLAMQLLHELGHWIAAKKWGLTLGRNGNPHRQRRWQHHRDQSSSSYDPHHHIVIVVISPSSLALSPDRSKRIPSV